MPATNELLQEESVSPNDVKSALPSLSGQGDTLDELLQRNKRAFPVSDVLTWADQLLDALASLHKASPAVFHQNVRPDSIVLSPDGSVKLNGAGRAAPGSFGESQIHFSPLEQIWDGLDAASQKVITNSYDERSERILKSPLDGRSDLYSLAATLYYLLTATQPIDALERSIEMLDGNTDPLPSPSDLNPQVPAEVSQVVLKALEIKRENRFDSATIMRQVLRSASAKFIEREAVETRPAEVAPIVDENKQAKDHDADEKRLHADLLEQKLRELEEQRREAEARAAEAERLLREKEEAAAHISTDPGAPDDELLELDISVVPNVEAHISVEPSDDSLIHITNSGIETIELSVIDEIPTPPPPHVKPDSKPHRHESEVEPHFSYQEASTRTSLFGVPMIAAGAVVVILVFVGIYFVGFAGSSEPKQALPVVTSEPKPEVQQEQPPPAIQEQPVQNPEPISSFASDANTAVPESEPAKTEPVTPTRAAVKPTPAPKENKPAKDPAKGKKPVTADDLINDN